MSLYNNLRQEDLVDLLEAYDSYIGTASDARLFETGWNPVCVDEFYGNEYQNVWLAGKTFDYMYDDPVQPDEHYYKVWVYPRDKGNNPYFISFLDSNVLSMDEMFAKARKAGVFKADTDIYDLDSGYEISKEQYFEALGKTDDKSVTVPLKEEDIAELTKDQATLISNYMDYWGKVHKPTLLSDSGFDFLNESGKYYMKDEERFVGFDFSSDSEGYLEEFDGLEECKAWLNHEFEINQKESLGEKLKSAKEKQEKKAVKESKQRDDEISL